MREKPQIAEHYDGAYIKPDGGGIRWQNAL